MPPSTSQRPIQKNSRPKRKQKEPQSPTKSESAGGSQVLVVDDAIYFFRPKGEHGYLSQWYASPFTDGTHSYENAEQYMMHQKGILFAPDSPITSSILETTNPRDIKSLGRMIPNFDEDTWRRDRLNIVTEGSRLKFRQSETLKAQLLATGERELVEASPFDRIWGVGFGAKQAPMKREKWGENLLGKALMVVRQELREELASDSAGSVVVLGTRSDLLGDPHTSDSQHSPEAQHPPARSIQIVPSPTQVKSITLVN